MTADTREAEAGQKDLYANLTGEAPLPAEGGKDGYSGADARRDALLHAGLAGLTIIMQHGGMTLSWLSG